MQTDAAVLGKAAEQQQQNGSGSGKGGGSGAGGNGGGGGKGKARRQPQQDTSSEEAMRQLRIDKVRGGPLGPTSSGSLPPAPRQTGARPMVAVITGHRCKPSVPHCLHRRPLNDADRSVVAVGHVLASITALGISRIRRGAVTRRLPRTVHVLSAGAAVACGGQGAIRLQLPADAYGGAAAGGVRGPAGRRGARSPAGELGPIGCFLVEAVGRSPQRFNSFQTHAGNRDCTQQR